MDKQTITIIVPVYNAQRTLRRCVSSIIAQTETNWELILVDDGSSDHSYGICEELQHQDSRITALHKTNGGAGSARNYGLSHCRTSWVTFIDADDTIEPGYLANFHLANHHDKTDIVIIQGYRRVAPTMDEKEERLDLKNADYAGQCVLENSFSHDLIFEYGQTFGKLYQSATILRYKIEFPQEFSLSEDHYFFLSYLHYVKEIITHKGMLYNYIFEDNISLSRKEHPYRELLIRYYTLTNVCKTLKQRDKFSDIQLNKIDYFATTGSISLLLHSLYRQESDIKVRITILNDLMSNRDSIKQTFHPHNFRGKLLRFIFLHYSPKFANFLLSIFMK